MKEVFYSYSELKWFLTHNREKNLNITIIEDFERTMNYVSSGEYKWFKSQLKERNITIKVKKVENKRKYYWK